MECVVPSKTTQAIGQIKVGPAQHERKHARYLVSQPERGRERERVDYKWYWGLCCTSMTVMRDVANNANNNRQHLQNNSRPVGVP